MHPHLAQVFARLDDSAAAVRAALAAVPPSLQRQRPAPERWSAAEIVEHLALVAGIFTLRLSAPLAAARARGLGAEQNAWTPLPEDKAAIMADRTATRNAPEAMLPTGQMDAARALEAFERAHQGFRDLLRGADGLALSTVTFDHAFFGTLNVYQWAQLMAAHERRHAEQIGEILSVR